MKRIVFPKYDGDIDGFLTNNYIKYTIDGHEYDIYKLEYLVDHNMSTHFCSKIELGIFYHIR